MKTRIRPLCLLPGAMRRTWSGVGFHLPGIAAALSIIMTPAHSGQESMPLPPEEIQSALVSEELSFPSPGEFFNAVSRSGRPNWGAAGRCGTNLNATSRQQIALNIGALISDGYLAVELQNSQEVKNTGRDILAMARKLNASDSVLARGSSINEFAENNEWNILKEELEATQNEIKLILVEQKDEPLLALISTGVWLRGIHSVTMAAPSPPSPEISALLRQSSIAEALLLRLRSLPDKGAGELPLASLISSMESLRDLLATEPGQAIAPETIGQINKLTGDLLRSICNPIPVATPQQAVVTAPLEVPQSPETTPAPPEPAP